VEGLREVGLAKGRGLLLVAEMSSEGNLISASYSEAAEKLAEKYADFAIGKKKKKKNGDIFGQGLLLRKKLGKIQG
jgi:hypothetical protein